MSVDYTQQQNFIKEASVTYFYFRSKTFRRSHSFTIEQELFY